MDYRVGYEHSLKSEPDAFIIQVPCHLFSEISLEFCRKADATHYPSLSLVQYIGYAVHFTLCISRLIHRYDYNHF